jgi:hypothetical protein
VGGHKAPGAGGSDADLVDGPIDLAAVRADDALIDALAGGTGGHDGDYGFGSGDDDRLAALLAAWRADVDTEPMPELVTLDEASEAVSAGYESHGRMRSRAKRRMPFAIAAAAAVVACAGLTVAVHGAMPGDTLWGVSKVFFSERAATVERVEDVRGHIVAANDALARGDANAARAQLQQANIVLPQVAPEAQAPLVAERDRVQSSITPEPARVTPADPSAVEPSSVPGSTAGGSEVTSDTSTPAPEAVVPAEPVSPAEPAAPVETPPEPQDAPPAGDSSAPPSPTGG